MVSLGVQRNNWDHLALIVTGAITAASVIVKLTPTQADDAVLAKVVRVLEVVSMAKRQPAVVPPAAAPHLDAMTQALLDGDTVALRQTVSDIDFAGAADPRR